MGLMGIVSNLSLVKVLVGLGSLSAAAAGVNEISKESVSHSLKAEILGFDETNSEDWNALWSKLKQDVKVNDSFLKQEKSKSENVSKPEILKKWCEDNISLRFSAWYSSSSKLKAVEDLNNFCIRTIGDKIGNEKFDVEGEQDKSEIIKKLKSLRTHGTSSDGSTGVNGVDLSKFSYLSSLKSSEESQDEQNWTKLRKWCKSSYEKGFVKDDDFWKLVNGYCRKPAAAAAA